MADEKKTYLINIESNLKKYADEAAEAKKKVDELKTANDALIESGKNSGAEFETNKAALKNANAEYAKAQKMVQLQVAANSSETGSRKQLGEILNLQMQALGKLGNAYVTNAQGIRVLNPLYVEQRNRIAATKQAIIEYDQKLNDGRSNIGRYGASVKAAIGEAASSMFAFAAPIAVATAALNGLKEAFTSTEAGAKLLGRAKLQLSAFFENLVTLKWRYAFGNQLPKDIKAVADLMDKIRIDQRNELVIVAQKELEINELRLESVKAGKGTVEQESLLVQAQEKEKELITYKIGQKQEELDAVNLLLAKQSTNTDLLNEQARLEAEILNIKGERSLKMATKLQAIDEKRIADAEKQKQKDLKDLELMNQYTNEYFDNEKKRNQESLAEKKRMNDYTNEYLDKEKSRLDESVKVGFEAQKIKARDNVDSLQTILNSEYGALLASVDYVRMTDGEKLLIDEQYTENTRQLSLLRMDQQLRELDAFASLAGSVSDLFGKQTIAAKGLSVAQALISTYTAGVKAMAELPLGAGPVLRFVTLAAVIAAGLVQVKNILAVKIPGGGGGESMPTSISASAPVQRMAANPVGSTILTQQQLTQPQLNAIPNQNPLTADDIAYALSKLPPPVVTVEDINAKTKSVNKVAVRANI
jgi:hypothetical protein